MALLKWVWPCWRKCFIVKVGFEVTYPKAFRSVTHSLSLLPVTQDASPAPSLPAHSHISHHDNMD